MNHCKQMLIDNSLARLLLATHKYAVTELDKARAEFELKERAISEQANQEMAALRVRVASSLGLSEAEASRMDLDITYFEQTEKAFAIVHADPEAQEEESSTKLH